ncbi:MAG: phosphopantothenoylcysteine decarboxylase [Cycloclasticus sp. symbiont of Poecilosclerida sp. M]|nr:MAG: phosphopantothenoylcysteine decarboxylase [Cycloclasticus sp. symbiont of Poecilosclerida sp. M]
MNKLQNRRVLLGVTGGIAAYKAAELLRLCQSQGAEVRVVMTHGATEFVAPLTFQALSGSPVHTQLLDAEEEAAMGHINLARWADVIIVAPASASFISRAARGEASDLLSAIILATEKKVLIAPAMNRAMYEDKVTQKNLANLTERGMVMLGPDEGLQACGETGFGRMLEPGALLQDVVSVFQTGVLAGLNVLLNAGPTREAIDPVRYISNHSSGKMGFAMAQACAEAGAAVTLVAGPVQLVTPSGVERMDVTSAAEMSEAVMAKIEQVDIFIATAAVADYTPEHKAVEKIKKNDQKMQLNLVKTVDIVSTVSSTYPELFCVGFAAETNDVEMYGKAKLKNKSLDMLAANLVGVAEGGFNSDENALKIFWSGGEHQFEMTPKHSLAQQFVELMAEKYNEKHTT